MIYRQLDENWDYTFGHSKAGFLKDAEAVAQAIKSRLLLFYGEWWEDTEDGLPFWQRIIGSPGNSDNLRAVDYLYKSRIQETEGVKAILAYESEFENRQYKFRAYV